MTATPTRTLNPLPLNDLEPHRFEDLVRQLAYEFRRWRSLEATGRLGSDEGIDIRATELVPMDIEVLDEVEEGNEPTDAGFTERLWVFQCKREKTLPPKRLRTVIKDSLASLATPPHGFVLAVACDVSKAARDVFRAEMATRGVGEFFIWGRSELEDMLFQPKNDRLLFAYFDIALQPRRRNAATSLRGEIAKKKQLAALIGDEEQRDGKLVMLRDPTDARYPEAPPKGEAPARWFLCRAMTAKKPGHLMVLRHEHLAAITEDGAQWDAILDFDLMPWGAKSELQTAGAWSLDDLNLPEQTPHGFWNEYIDASRRARLQIHRAVPLERILAIDPLGDGPYPVPHLLVEFADADGPFTPDMYVQLTPTERMGRPPVDIVPEAENRAAIFPKPLPDDNAPPPAGFDDTAKKAPALSRATKERLTALLPPAASGQPETDGHSRDPRRGTESRVRLHAFEQWRTTVAAPTLSSFALALRAAGHYARVILRGPTDAEGAHSASIELRVKIGTARYRPQGHVRITWWAHTADWRLEIHPEAGSGGRTSGRPPTQGSPTVNGETTSGDLEALLLTMLERLCADRASVI